MRLWYSTGPERLKRAKIARELCEDISIWRKGYLSLSKEGFYLGQNDRGWKAGPEYILALKHMETLVDRGYEFDDMPQQPTDPWLANLCKQNGVDPEVME